VAESGPSAPRWGVDAVVRELRAARERWRAARGRNRDAGGREFPAPDALQGIVQSLRAALFPMRLGPRDLRQESEDRYIAQTLQVALDELAEQIQLEFDSRAADKAVLLRTSQARDIVAAFATSLPRLRAVLDTDVEAAYRGDPAAHSVDEVLLCYPGVLALINHRLAHELYRLGAPVVARIVAEIAHSETGIDIHPGATIGGSFFIDHGTGVVIGETAVIGERVRLYQAVTLGAKRFDVDAHGELRKGEPRHPIVEDDVVIYAGATILGRVTIGRGSTIGGNVWLTRSVPAGSHVTQAQSEHS
jgi:serine O-acetyltransferase